MADTVEVLVTEFRADIKRFEASMRKQAIAAEKAAGRQVRAFNKANRSIRASGDATARFLQSRFAAAALFTGLTGATNVIANFGQAMSSVQAVTGATSDQISALTARARELGATTRFSATEAAEGMLFLSRAGFSVDQTLASIEPTLKLAQAGALGLGDAADISSNILQAFQLDVSELSRVVDVMAKTTNSSNTDIRQLGDAMKLVAPVAATFGVDIEETSAAIGVLSDAGMQATLAGTGLRRIMGELQSPTTATKKILSEYGLTAEDVKISTVGFSGALQALSDAGFDANRSLEVFGQRGGPAFANVFAGFENGKIADLEEKLRNAAGTADKMAVIMDDNLAGAMKRALSKLQELILTLGELGAEQALIDFFNSLAYSFERLAEAAVETSRAWQKFTSGNKELTTATFEASDAIGAYEKALKDANELTGAALENANALADARRLEAIETLEAAQAERKLAIEREKNIAREIRSFDFRDGSVLAKEQREELKKSSAVVAELERQSREAQDQMERLLSKTYKVRSEAGTLPTAASAPSGSTSSSGSQSKEIDDIFAQVGERFDEAMARAREQVEVEISMLEKLQDARDEMHGRQLAITEREYERRRQAIESEIKDETRKQEALALLAEERAEYERQLRAEVLGSAGEGEVDQVRSVEAQKLAALQEALELEHITREEFAERKLELEQQTEDRLGEIRAKSMQFQIAAGEKLFGSLSDLAKEFAGDQSGVYKTLFAIEKAFSIASSLIAIQTGVAQALSLPFPANLGAAASVAAAGASVVANIRSVSADGFADGVIGLRGPGTGRSDDIPAFLSRGESVITATGTARNAALLSAINSGANVEGALRSGSLGAGRAISVSSGPVIIEGNVDQDVYDRFEVELSQRDARLVDDVNRILDRANLLKTPRHLR